MYGYDSFIMNNLECSNKNTLNKIDITMVSDYSKYSFHM